MDSPLLPQPLSLLRPGGAPPPPPKNPARLMALALAEQAQQVAQRQSQQEHGGTPSAPRSPFYCSLSLEVGGEPLGISGSGPPASSLSHPDAWAPGPPPSLPRQQSVGSLVRSQRPMGTSRRGHRSSAQVSAQEGWGFREVPETLAQFLCCVSSQVLSSGRTPGCFSSAPQECLPPFLGVPKPGLYPLTTSSFQPSSPTPVWRSPLGPSTPLDRGENLYSEIEAGEGSPYSGTTQSWSPFRSMPPDRLTASYGMLAQSSPFHRSPDFLLSYPPPPSCFPHNHLGYSALQHPARCPTRPEPLYVNLALGPRGPSSTSSSSSSPPAPHPHSHSDSGPTAPHLPQKERAPLGPHTPHRVPGAWGSPEPLLYYRAAPPAYGRQGKHHQGSLYRNGDQGREGAGPPPPYPTPSWSLHSDGQTRSYC